MKIYFHIVLFILFFQTITLQAQDVDSVKAQVTSYLKTRPNNKTLDNSEKLYFLLDSVYNSANFLDIGRVFNNYFGIKGTPFLLEEITEGKIAIGDYTFSPAFLLYDIFSDEVICRLKSADRGVILVVQNKLKVTDFYLATRHFINLTQERNDLNGYYELIYKGAQFSMLIKWQKGVDIRTSANEGDEFSKAQRKIYLVNKQNSSRIRSKKDFIRFLSITKANFKKKYPHKFPRLSHTSIDELKKLALAFN